MAAQCKDMFGLALLSSLSPKMATEYKELRFEFHWFFFYWKSSFQREKKWTYMHLKFSELNSLPWAIYSHDDKFQLNRDQMLSKGENSFSWKLLAVSQNRCSTVYLQIEHQLNARGWQGAAGPALASGKWIRKMKKAEALNHMWFYNSSLMRMPSRTDPEEEENCEENKLVRRQLTRFLGYCKPFNKLYHGFCFGEDKRRQAVSRVSTKGRAI